MKPSEVRDHLLQKRYDPVSLPEDTLTTIYAAIYGAKEVTLYAPEGAQNLEIKDDVLGVIHHLLMMRWHAEWAYRQEEAEKINYSEHDTFFQRDEPT